MMKNDAWNKLAALARKAPAPAEDGVPFGFAARVVALSKTHRETEPSPLAAWEWLSFRSLALAGVLALASLAINYDLLTPGQPGDLAMADPGVDTLAEP
jgi:hypothetical protein